MDVRIGLVFPPHFSVTGKSRKISQGPQISRGLGLAHDDDMESIGLGLFHLPTHTQITPSPDSQQNDNTNHKQGL